MLARLIRSWQYGTQGADYAQRFEGARLAYAQGDFGPAEIEFAALAKLRPTDAEAWLYAGLCAYRQHNAALALERFVKARDLDPGNHDYLYQEAAALSVLGSVEQAKAVCARLAARAPDYAQVRFLWAALELPGDDYMAFMRQLHDFLKPATYLEIGVFQGRSLALVGPGTLAIGVDPEPRIDTPIPPNARVVAKTSDDFFAANDVLAELGGRPLALGFIDGMHRFEFALRDFINMERICAADSTILIHDCYPLNRASATRDWQAQFWSGDVWRLILILKKYRPKLQVHTLALAPTGLGMVRGLDPQSTLLADRYESIVAEFMEVDYDVLAPDKAGMLNRFPNDWQAILRLLGKH